MYEDEPTPPTDDIGEFFLTLIVCLIVLIMLLAAAAVGATVRG